jgi:DNA-binding NarL/FixJ family response regulator
MRVNAGDAMRKTVLIVDDSVFIRNALCELFTRQSDFTGCGVAENGREAIEVARRVHPDLIVLDLKRVLPAVLLIMCSAFEGRLSEKLARLIGISEVVSKFDPPSLLLEKAHALAYRIPA